MSNLEHLLEDGLKLLETKKTYEEWFSVMEENQYWTERIGTRPDELWTICQYIKNMKVGEKN